MRDVFTYIFFELLHQVVNQGIVKVLSTKKSITIG